MEHNNHTNADIDFYKYIFNIAVKENLQRKNCICNILVEHNLPFIIQKADPISSDIPPFENIVINTGDQKIPHLLFCAHYDSFQDSTGANDNAAAICILLRLAHHCLLHSIPASFALFDQEETGRTGSTYFVNHMDNTSITAVVNLDLCGFGDTIAVFCHGSSKKPSIRNFCSKAFLAKHSGKLVKYLPDSDDISFKSVHLPVLNIAVMPKSDTHYLRILSSYANNILGRPPEFDMILSQMQVVSTIHGNPLDKPESVQVKAMDQVYEYLLDCISTPTLNRLSDRLFH